MKNLNMLPEMNALTGYATDTHAQPVPSRVHVHNLLVDASPVSIASPEPPSVTLTDGDKLASKRDIRSEFSMSQFSIAELSTAELSAELSIEDGSIEGSGSLESITGLKPANLAERWEEQWEQEWDEKCDEMERSPLALRRGNSMTKILTLVGGKSASYRRTFSGDCGDGDGGSADGDDAGGSRSECGWFIERMSAYQDGELENNDTRLVAAHIEGCTRCTRIFAALQATDDLLQREWRDDAPLPASSSLLTSSSASSVVSSVVSSVASSIPSSSSPSSVASVASARFERAIDGIMAALPAQQSQTPAFPCRHVQIR